MKTHLLSILFFSLCISSCIAVNGATKSNVDADVANATALLQRLLHSNADSFTFRKSADKNGKDCFTIASEGSKIVITGNNANSMAMGLNRYLQKYCLTTVSWYDDIAVELPKVLPAVPAPESGEAKVKNRFFLNYCTYGYTMPFWQWPQWERIIDWMALNGVNMPLAITGEEAVYYNVYRKLGMTDSDIREFFTGPAYLPWHRMANIDSWNGPLPKQWLDNQIELQKRILDRERQLNMHPVLPAFAGHVPGKLHDIFPKSNIKDLTQWAGFDAKYRCHFLNPDDPLFAKIQKMFLTEQTKLFGTDHIYGVDPFNEVEPPSWEPNYLKKVSSDMFKTLTDVDKKAVWMQMAWMFFYDSKHWTPATIKALLNGVPKGRMILLDYHCENTELWKRTESFYGQPYIWCYLGNFGGNTPIYGNAKECAKRLDAALASGNSNFVGIGSTLEGLDVMQFPYELLFEKAWTYSNGNFISINSLADRHLGYASPVMRQAWNSLYNSIYVQLPSTNGILTNYRPKLGKSDYRTAITFSSDSLLKVWKQLVSVPDCNRDAMRLDMIVVGRQALGGKFLDVKNDFDKAYSNHDIPALQRDSALMVGLLSDINSLTAMHPHCSLSSWLGLARDMGDTPALKDYYEHNARNIITTWGGTIDDYASRTWAGLVSSYYTPRWTIFISDVIAAVRQGKEFSQKSYNAKVSAFEQGWVNSCAPIFVPNDSKADVLSFSKYLVSKYFAR
jgi:alpha-N-acetylglucosaminidase